MVYPQSRSVVAELNEGATDGKYKKVVNNRGGVVEQTTQAARADLKDIWYGIHEAPVKVRPDMQHVTTPNCVYTHPAEPTV